MKVMKTSLSTDRSKVLGSLNSSLIGQGLRHAWYQSSGKTELALLSAQIFYYNNFCMPSEDAGSHVIIETQSALRLSVDEIAPRPGSLGAKQSSQRNLRFFGVGGSTRRRRARW